MRKIKGNGKCYYRLTVFEENDKDWQQDFDTYEEAVETYEKSKYLNGMEYEIIKFKEIENGIEE